MNKLIEQYYAQKEKLTAGEYFAEVKHWIEQYADERKDEIDTAFEDSEFSEFANSLTDEELDFAITSFGLYWEVIHPLFVNLVTLCEKYNHLECDFLLTGEGYCPLSAREAYDFIMSPPRDLDILKNYEVLSLLSAAEAEDYQKFEMEYNKLDPSVIAKPLAEIMEEYNLLQLPYDLFSSSEITPKEIVEIYSFVGRKIFLNYSKYYVELEKECPWIYSFIKFEEQSLKNYEHNQVPFPIDECKACLQTLLSKYEEIKEDLSKTEIEFIEGILSNEEYNDIIDDVRSDTFVDSSNTDDTTLTLPKNFYTEKSTMQSGFINKLPEAKRTSGLADLINWLAKENFIDRDSQTRKSLAFILSGQGYQEGLLSSIKWYGTPKLILVMCKLLYGCGKKTNVPWGTYGRAKEHFDCGSAQESFMDMKPSPHADPDRTRAGKYLKAKMKEFFASN